MVNQTTMSLQGVALARMSQYCTEGELVERCYSDVSTLLEAFQRGARVSGECGDLPLERAKNTSALMCVA